MAFIGLKLLRTARAATIIYRNVVTSSATVPNGGKVSNMTKQYKTEDNFVYLEDPDTFGTLSRPASYNEQLEDEGDKKELEFIEKNPLPSQKLTIKQYSDLIKQYLNYKRLKEAINVLEVKMLKEDRVKPDNYIYNILIGACADVGYTKKAFKLFNDMKKRGLIPTGDTYTCLFEACVKSPWMEDGLKNAQHLRNLMIDKGIEPNLTNFNAMIKAFGRCGDLPTAFQIVDEMISKKIKIRVHTFNHLLQACITDKQSGLRHALVVWRKMLKLREKPNIYSFNLMLKCVKECNLGSKEDIEDLIRIIQHETPLAIQNKQQTEILRIESPEELQGVLLAQSQSQSENSTKMEPTDPSTSLSETHTHAPEISKSCAVTGDNLVKTPEATLHFVNNLPLTKNINDRTVPNLLSKKINFGQVLSFQDVNTVQGKFAIIGGQEDFLKEMDVYSVKPDVKTFTQMLFLLDDNVDSENKLLETMKDLDIKADIEFYNMLIKKRCLRFDYDNAINVKDIIEQENKLRKKKHPLKKKLKLKFNVMTYGVLAMACKTKDDAEKLLTEMKENQLKVNTETLGALLRQGTAHYQFDYVIFIMNVVKDENVQLNDKFLKHLESFNDKCCKLLQKNDENEHKRNFTGFEKAYKKFVNFYKKWLKNVNIEEVLQPEHPWNQFRDEYPESVQRSNFKIEKPKRFFRRSRKYVMYTAKL